MQGENFSNILVVEDMDMLMVSQYIKNILVVEDIEKDHEIINHAKGPGNGYQQNCSICCWNIGDVSIVL